MNQWYIKNYATTKFQIKIFHKNDIKIEVTRTANDLPPTHNILYMYS